MKRRYLGKRDKKKAEVDIKRGYLGKMDKKKAEVDKNGGIWGRGTIIWIKDFMENYYC